MSNCVMCGKTVYEDFTNGLCYECINEWSKATLGDPDLIGDCDTCGAFYDVSSRDGRCGDCGECSEHCTHV